MLVLLSELICGVLFTVCHLVHLNCGKEIGTPANLGTSKVSGCSYATRSTRSIIV